MHAVSGAHPWDLCRAKAQYKWVLSSGCVCGCVQLKIVTWQNEEVASDALSVHGYEHYEATDYALAAWYPRRPRAHGAPEDAAGTSGRSTDFTKWWADGDEPLYYIISSKVPSLSWDEAAVPCACLFECPLDACQSTLHFVHVQSLFLRRGCRE